MKTSKHYLERTEFIVNLFHQFENQYCGKNIHIFVVCGKKFLPSLKKKIRQGRFSDYLEIGKNGVLSMHHYRLKNRYTIDRKLFHDCTPAEYSIYFTVMIDPRFIDQVDCLKMNGYLHLIQGIMESNNGSVFIINKPKRIPSFGEIVSHNELFYTVCSLHETGKELILSVTRND